MRDDRVALIANELVVPDFSNAQPNRPLAVSLPTRQCTIDKVTALKQVLARHPGTSQVHLRLISGDRITTLELDAVPSGYAVARADGRSQGAARPGLPGRLAVQFGGLRECEVSFTLAFEREANFTSDPAPATWPIATPPGDRGSG